MYERVKKINCIEFNLLKICINSDILDSLSSYHRKVEILLFSHAVLLIKNGAENKGSLICTRLGLHLAILEMLQCEKK